jgi:hypothetical protein
MIVRQSRVEIEQLAVALRRAVEATQHELRPVALSPGHDTDFPE